MSSYVWQPNYARREGPVKAPRKTTPVDSTKTTTRTQQVVGRDPLSLAISRIMGQYQSPAQQQARAKSLVDQMINAQYAAAQESTRLAQEQQYRQQAAMMGYAGALHTLSDRQAAQIQQAYGRAGTEMGDFARALSYGIVAPSETAALQNAQGIVNRYTPGQGMTVQGAGDPQANAGVLNYLGGTLPVSNINAQQAQQVVSELMGSRKNDAVTMQLLGGSAQKIADLQDALTSKRLEIEAQRPKTMSDLMAQYEDQQSKNTALAAQLYGLKNTLRTSEANLTGRDPVTGTKTPAMIRAENATLGYSKMITQADGSVVGIKKDGTQEMVRPPGSVSQPYRGGNWQMKVMPDGSTRYFNPQTRETVKGDPKGTYIKPNKKPPSTKSVASANQYLDSHLNGYYASSVEPNKPLTTSQIQSLAKAAGMTVRLFLARLPNNATAQQKKDYTKGMIARQKAGIARYTVDQHEDQQIQQLYTTLIQQYGIPARRAFAMLKKRYPTWAQSVESTYFPTGGA